MEGTQIAIFILIHLSTNCKERSAFADLMSWQIISKSNTIKQ